MIRFITLNLITINYITEYDRNSLRGMIHPTHLSHPSYPICNDSIKLLSLSYPSTNYEADWKGVTSEISIFWEQMLNFQVCRVCAISSLPGVPKKLTECSWGHNHHWWFTSSQRYFTVTLFLGHPLDRQSSVKLDLFLAFSLLTYSSSHCIVALHPLDV